MFSIKGPPTWCNWMKYTGWERETDVKINSTQNLQLTAIEEVGKTEVLAELNNKLLQRRNSREIPSQIENFYNAWWCFCWKSLCQIEIFYNTLNRFSFRDVCRTRSWISISIFWFICGFRDLKIQEEISNCNRIICIKVSWIFCTQC